MAKDFGTNGEVQYAVYGKFPVARYEKRAKGVVFETGLCAGYFAPEVALEVAKKLNLGVIVGEAVAGAYPRPMEGGNLVLLVQKGEVYKAKLSLKITRMSES